MTSRKDNKRVVLSLRERRVLAKGEHQALTNHQQHHHSLNNLTK
jgi:hypothetical protein